MGKSKDLATGETRFVNTAGDTMTGDLTISSTAGQLKLTDTDGTEQNTTIKQSGGNLFIQSRDNTNNAGVVFAGNGGGNYSEHMRINASGQVTMPSQPAFAGKSHSAWHTATQGNTIVVDFVANSILYNTGNHFNVSNNRFVAPIAGKYLFHTQSYVKLDTSDDDGNHGYIWIKKNGSGYLESYEIFGYMNSGDADQTVTVTTIMDMAVNDYATLELTGASGSTSYYGPATNFSGYLLG